MAVDWRLASQADPGASFQHGYQNALVQRQQQEDRQIQMQQRDAQMQQQRQQQQFQLTDRHRQDIRLGAGIARQYEQRSGRPMDEAGWQAVRAAAQQAGVDLTDVPEHFDPQYYQQLQASAQTLESQSGPAYTLGAGDRRFDAGNNVVATGGPDVTHQPSIQREVDYYRSIGREDLAQQLLENHAEGAPVLFDVTGDGVPDLVSRAEVRRRTGQGGGQPAPQTQTPEQLTALAEEAIRNGADPVAVRARLQQMLSRQGEAPAFRPAPGGPAPGQGNFPQ